LERSLLPLYLLMCFASAKAKKLNCLLIGMLIKDHAFTRLQVKGNGGMLDEKENSVIQRSRGVHGYGSFSWMQ
jgi:hypothetical protein